MSGEYSKNHRAILESPLDKDGYFVPPKNFTADDEVKWAKRRMDSARIAQYADMHCSMAPATYDETGAYLCGGRSDGSSSPCNKMVQVGAKPYECLIRTDSVSPHKGSCAYWETSNAGDPEGRYCPKSKEKMDDGRISYDETDNPLGWSCGRCEYGQNKMPMPDSEGRELWCKLKGHTVEPNACCAENEPYEDDGYHKARLGLLSGQYA